MKELDKLFEKELNKRTENIKLQNENLLKQNALYEEEITRLQNLVADLSKGDLFSKYAKNVNESNLGDFLKFIFDKKDNIDSQSQTTKAPPWFFYMITYWSQRELLFKVYDLIGIKYPKWAKSFRIPYEWDQTEIDHWFSTMRNHYVCNGAIYDSNLGFWYEVCQNKSPVENMNKTYSEIPWNLVLKNPLLLEPHNFNRITEELYNNINKGNWEYFYRLGEYQDLSSTHTECLMECLLNDEYIQTWDSLSRNAIKILIKKLPFESTLWEEAYKKEIIPVISATPVRIQKMIILDSSIGDRLTRAMASGLFSKKELDKIYNEQLRKLKIKTTTK